MARPSFWRKQYGAISHLVKWPDLTFGAVAAAAAAAKVAGRAALENVPEDIFLAMTRFSFCQGHGHDALMGRHNHSYILCLYVVYREVEVLIGRHVV
jgi:hypothetical protein